MRFTFSKIFLILLLAALATSCSRKNNTFLSRNFHAVTAEYNALYNGEVAFDEGRDALTENYRDNFYEILPVEPLERFEDVTVPGASKNPNFERAEEKAIKAIQKHNMEINGEEHNPQMDEAFMLLGKARYYDQRFVRALESFNYILGYYPASNNIAQAKIWKAKTNIRLQNDTVAIANLHKLLDNEKKLKNQDYADASAMLAQAYLNKDRKDSALVYIDKAAMLTRKREQEGRYLFIKAQLYDAIDEHGLANETYDKVIHLNRKIPRSFLINAYIAKARNFDYDTEDRIAFLELLEDLKNDRENRPFLGGIYNEIGEYYRNTGDIDSAVANYNRSLRVPVEDRYLSSRNYLTLGNINFDAAKYPEAGAYYDSTLVNIAEHSREYRAINKKRENLNDVIRYEQTAKKNDSILILVKMSDEDRRAYFEDYIAKLKEQAKKDSITNVTAGIQNNEFFKAGSGNSGPKGGTFYFYEPARVAQGKLDFKSRWGNRELTDNWRLSGQQSSLGGADAVAQNEDAIPGADTRYDLDRYLESVPTAQGHIDTLARDRDFANYQLGLIYKEKFKEYGLAADRLETLLRQKPEERLILPAKYNLYKIYTEQGDAANQEKYRQDILAQYPDSRYAAFIKNPNKALEKDAESPEALYNQLYRKFEAQKYAEVIKVADEEIDQLAGDVFVPKFELLKATAIGRLKGYTDYKDALNYVALNYPDRPEGKKAQQTLTEVLPQLKDAGFKDDASTKNWKIIYIFPSDQLETIAKETQVLQQALETYFYTQYYISRDVYTADQTLIVVHGFTSNDAAQAFAERLTSDQEIKWKQKAIFISSDNYRIVQLHKNLEAYKTKDQQ